MGFLSSALGGFGGSSLGSAIVSLGVDPTQLEAGLAKARGEVAATTDASSADASQFAQAWDVAGAIAVGAVLKFASSAIQAAEEHQVVLAKLATATGQVTTRFEEQAKATALATGFNEDEILSLDTILSRFDLTQTSLKAATAATLDYARATGQDAATAAQLIGKASLGNARALKTLGISFKATGDQGKDMATVLGLIESKVGGQAAAYADTYAGKLAILGAQFHEIEVEIGTKLIPVVSNFIGEISTAIGWVERLNADLGVLGANAGSVIANLPFIGPALANEFQGAPENITKFNDALAGVQQQLVSGKITLEESQQKVQEWGTALGISGDNITQVQTSLAHLDSAQGGAADSAALLAQQEADLAQHLQDVKTAQDALAGGLLGAVSAQDQLNTDTRAYERLLNRQNASQKDVHAAFLQMLQDRLSVTAADKAFIDSMHTSEDTSRQVWRTIANDLGITIAQAQKLAGEVKSVTNAINSVPTHKQVVFSFGATGPPNLLNRLGL